MHAEATRPLVDSPARSRQAAKTRGWSKTSWFKGFQAIWFHHKADGAVAIPTSLPKERRRFANSFAAIYCSASLW